MKVVFTDEALRDLDHIFRYISEHYPAVYRPFEGRLRAIVMRIATWPESAQEVLQKPAFEACHFSAIRTDFSIVWWRIASKFCTCITQHAKTIPSISECPASRSFGPPPSPARGGGIRRDAQVYAFFFRKKLHQPAGLTSPATSWQVFGGW